YSSISADSRGVARDVAKGVAKKATKNAILWLIGTIGLPFTLLILFIILIALVVPLGIFASNTFTPYGNAPYGYYDGGMGFGLSPVLGAWSVLAGGEFGAPRDYGAHEGVDLAATLGTPVVAMVSGILEFDETPLGGLAVFLKGEDERTYVYMHLGERMGYSGLRVKAGEVIGKIGMTGRTTGPHLHFEIRENGRNIDPMPILKSVILPGELLFKDIDVQRAINWINSYLHKDSLIATPENINVLIDVGRQFNINPLLLIAIIGQEQSFVPAGSSSKILGNPFNVYGSWESYSPGLETSAKVAARTIVSLSKGRPEGTHPIHWLNSVDNPNGMYATDPTWWRGVTWFLDSLQKNS
ncbi:MAG: M23 family metallopeptidase, partial [Desulfocucumaceae bacterium]